MIPGHATPEATRRFHARHPARDHARTFGELALSSVGIGTYLGPADDATDARYTAAISRAIELGINVIDTASNYRGGRSERCVGRAVATAARDELVIASKAGFLPTRDPAPYIAAGLARADEIAAGCHCMTPAYLADQLAKSRVNTGLSTIDVYYLHNPETQLEEVDRTTFLARMRAAFAALEAAGDAGHLRWYGTATWNGYREPGLLDLSELVGLAREVAGDRHRFKFVQLPLNQRMPEAIPLLATAHELGMYVMSSASILQGKLAGTLEWTRTRPQLGTALVGMSRVEHVEANARVYASDATSVSSRS